MANSRPKSVVFVQYAGDYGETYRQLSGGGSETYYAQRYSIDAVGALVNPTTKVATICCRADSESDTLLDNGVRAISLLAPHGVDERRVWEKVLACAPTHLCLRTPLAKVLARALREDRIESLLLTLADSFNPEGLRARLSAWNMRRMLNHAKVIAVGNHGIKSSESLRRIGVDPSRIIPWDWPHSVTPHQATPKKSPGSTRPWTLLFVGMLTESKGIGDVLRAVGALKASGVSLTLTYAGRGDAARFTALTRELGIEDRVTCLGSVAHSEVVPLMRAADLIVVPSRHDYPEGFPMTIYEALSSRTPIVASDHPMYSRHLAQTQSAVIYRAADPASLADAIRTLMANPPLYDSLSTASASAWDQLQLPVTWGDLIQQWCRHVPGTPFDLAKYALAHTGSGLVEARP